MAEGNSTNSDLAYADTLWKSADALRGQVDAAEYKHVVLGLLFLKYISDSFDARREALKVELEADGITGSQMESLLENRDEYIAERVFWVPPEARWANLQNQATRPDIATLIDDAILAVERDNPNLKGKLPRDYARRGIEPVKLKGHIGLMPERRRFPRYIMGNSMLRVRCDRSKLLPEYLHYWLRSPAGQHYLLSRVSQVGVPQIQRPLTTLREAALPVPPLSEQEAITGILGALDDKIEQNRRTARTLERLAQSIFRAWFVDFEPVKAKATGETSFPSMPQSAFDVLPTRLVEFEIGPVPEGWTVGAIGSFATLSKIQVKPQDFPQEVFDHFSIPAFDAGMRPVVEPGTAIKSNKFVVLEGCMLVSKLNPRIPRVWLPPKSNSRRQIASTEFLVLVPGAPIDRHYLYCQFQQPDFREDLAQSASGTSNSHQRVRPNDMLGKAIVVPPESIRQQFAGIVDLLFVQAAVNHAESVKLAEMRDYLLPKLLTGQVRVTAAQHLLETEA